MVVFLSHCFKCWFEIEVKPRTIIITSPAVVFGKVRNIALSVTSCVDSCLHKGPKAYMSTTNLLSSLVHGHTKEARIKCEPPSKSLDFRYVWGCLSLLLSSEKDLVTQEIASAWQPGAIWRMLEDHPFSLFTPFSQKNSSDLDACIDSFFGGSPITSPKMTWGWLHSSMLG